MGKRMFYKAVLKFVKRKPRREEPVVMLTEIFGDRTRQRKYSSIAKGKLLCIAGLHSFFPEDRLRARKLDYKSGAGKLHELARRR